MFCIKWIMNMLILLIIKSGSFFSDVYSDLYCPDFWVLSTFIFLLQSTPCKHPVIVLQDVAFSDLHALVEFIYHGEVNVHQRSLSSFLKTAEVLRVSGLTQQADQTDRDEVSNNIYIIFYQLIIYYSHMYMIRWNLLK